MPGWPLSTASGPRSARCSRALKTLIDNLQVIAENLSASRSRILDADFAAETANLARSQILQQAGAAMVAQANQLPQGVLALLHLIVRPQSPIGRAMTTRSIPPWSRFSLHTGC